MWIMRLLAGLLLFCGLGIGVVEAQRQLGWLTTGTPRPPLLGLGEMIELLRHWAPGLDGPLRGLQSVLDGPLTSKIPALAVTIAGIVASLFARRRRESLSNPPSGASSIMMSRDPSAGADGSPAASEGTVEAPPRAAGPAAASSAPLVAVTPAQAAAAPAAAPDGPPKPMRPLDAVDREFLPAALELLETPPSPVRIAAIWMVVAFFSAAMLWAYVGQLDIHAVAQGRIQPTGRSKVVQPLEPGKVVKVMVENGAKVAAGDVLIELDPTETGADRAALSRDLESVQGEAARRRAVVTAAREDRLDARQIVFPDGVGDAIRAREQDVMAADLSQLAAQRASLKAQLAEKSASSERLKASIAARERPLALAQERVQMRASLVEKGSLSRALVIDSEQQFEQLMSQQVADKGQLAEAVAGMETLERKLEESVLQFIADQTTKLLDAERKGDRLVQELVKARTKNERLRLVAPIAGTVQQLAVTTVGQVVNSGQALMTIVPSEGTIEIEALIQNQDIGFVEPGQPAVIKIESFPFTRYGTLDGAVLRVSHDAVDEREASGLSDPSAAARTQTPSTLSAPARSQNLVFPATVRLTRSSINVEGKEINLTPGMAVTVEIRTGQRRVIDYVLSPLRQVTGSSGHER